jgi:hypothetical protein
MLKVDNLRVDQTNKNRITRLKRKVVDIGLPKPSIGQDWIKARNPQNRNADNADDYIKSPNIFSFYDKKIFVSR